MPEVEFLDHMAALSLVFFWGTSILFYIVVASTWSPTKTLAPRMKSYDKARQYIKKQRHHFANKGLYSQSYGISSSPVQMWKLDHEEGWAPTNRCFHTVVL